MWESTSYCDGSILIIRISNVISFTSTSIAISSPLGVSSCFLLFCLKSAFFPDVAPLFVRRYPVNLLIARAPFFNS